MDETDLLEPIAGPSNTSSAGPVDLLTTDLDELDDDAIVSTLHTLGNDEAVEICIRLVEGRPIIDASTAGRIIDAGVARSADVAEESEARVKEKLGSTGWTAIDREQFCSAMETVLADDQPAKRMLESHVRLIGLRRRLDTFEAFAPSAEAGPSRPRARAKAQEEDMDIDDPWAENEEGVPELDDPWESGSTKSARSVQSAKSAAGSAYNAEEQEGPPISLSAFLVDPLSDSACTLASGADLRALGLVYGRHRSELWPYRFAILDAIPPWISPADIEEIGLLPALGPESKEIRPMSQTSSFVEHLEAFQPISASIPAQEVMSVHEVRDWLIARVDSLDALGLLDVQLAWIQHGASLGIPDLDAIGEELSLLSRLVYDANLSPKQQAEWSLASWRRASPDTVIKAYISNSIQSGIVSDVRRLVLPYLYVLESKAERAGEPHTELVENHLHDIILSLPLNLALPLFEASKATLSASERIIKNDLTVARLALACLYGSNERNKWSIMSSIFECLPVWDVSGGDPESDKEATSTTLDSIATFIRPTRAGAHPPTPKDLFIFFAPLPFASLSRALDILDVHLESGEILARWDTPVQLRFLLQSAKNKEDQLELAEKMVRRQLGGKHTETRWIGLWGDMKKLSGGEDALMRGAFGVLEREDMLRIYLGGVISSGSEQFDIARKIVTRLQSEEGIPEGMLEQAVLQASREFYENAESGNIHTGEMKLAYDCLSVAPSTEDIVKEREFIEATSRISTFSIKSPSGRGTLSPLEIRHAKNRLDLVRQILETSDDAYRHPELVLDLTSKLGYHKDASAKIRVLALLTGAATKAGEYDTAFAHSQQMFALASKRHVETDVAWKALLDLGSQVDYAEIPNRMTVLGQAVELCPTEELPRILTAWRKVEEGQNKLSEAAKRRRITGVRSTTYKRPSAPSSVASTNAAEEKVLGSRTAARAARLAMGFAGNHLNLRGIAPSPLTGSPATPTAGGATPRSGPEEDIGRRSNESDRPSFGAMFEGAGVKAGTAEAERVRQQARKALVRGVGWLLGADDREITEGH